MGRSRKQRRQQHGSAWHWKQTDAWYYTRPGTKKRMSLVEAAQNVVPVAKTACESISRLRAWAVGRCLSADVPGIYSGNGSLGSVKPGRKVRRDPSNN